MVALRVILILLLLAPACAETIQTQWPERTTWSSYVKLNELSLGMSRAEVEGIMGQPPIREEGDYRGGRYVFYFYRTHNMDFDESNTVRGGYTPLVFKSDRLAGVGARDYRWAVDRSVDGRFPGLPWNRTQ